jgi:hypothetical protein
MLKKKHRIQNVHVSATVIQKQYRKKKDWASPTKKKAGPAVDFTLEENMLGVCGKLASKLDAHILKKDSLALAALAPEIGKDNAKYTDAKQLVLKMAPSQDALGGMVMLLCARETAKEQQKAEISKIWAKVSPDGVLVETAEAMIDAVALLCVNGNPIDLASVLGDQLKVVLVVLSCGGGGNGDDLFKACNKSISEFKTKSLSKLKQAQRQSARKLKSSGLPLSGLNFTLACIQLGINSVDAGELKQAVMGGVKVVGGIAHSILTMKLDSNLISNAKKFVMSGAEAAVQQKAKKATSIMYIPNALYYKAATAPEDILTFRLPVHTDESTCPTKHIIEDMILAAPALPTVHTESSLPRWEIVCSTVDLLGQVRFFLFLVLRS